MSPDPLSSIAINNRAQARFFMIEVARRLKERHGSRLHMYCHGPQEMAFFRDRGGDLFDSITDSDIFLPATTAPVADPGAELEKARGYEARLGTTYAELAMANRHLGRGYALGGFHFPRSSYSERSGYPQLLRAHNETLSFWENEFQDKSVGLVINGGKLASSVAEMMDIPYRVLAGARYRNHWYWGWNDFYENPLIRKAFEEGVEGGELALDAPYDDHLELRARFLKNDNPLMLGYRLSYLTARFVYWRLRGFKKARGYYHRDVLKHQIRSYTGRRKLSRMADTTLDDLEGTPFVFYPLHLEPELAFQSLSPEYFYQLSSIAAVARDLPAGAVLVIKEHLNAIGSRPDNFYDQIAAFKNVKMLDPSEFGLNVVRKAKAVVTVSGTAGFEAAVMGKPVISFGRHNTYNFLPHVSVVTDESRLKSYLRTALERDGSDPRPAADGRRFLQAIVAASFDMLDHSALKPETFDPAVAENAYAMLVRGLEEQIAMDTAAARATGTEARRVMP